ncbi:MAG TPA: alpha/beta hydrolase [Mycobacteriales bacterium]|jgi:pimeloyl-ACP methyl ester carboxylesterase|nr:alpha/beta hydrolase [Mycobacteriales bacterium]
MEIKQTTVEANGLTFAALTCGEEGPLALCLHGFPDSAHTWRHLLPELAAAGYRAVAPWLRGYAPTVVPSDGDYSAATLSADVNALHHALGGGIDAVLVGHDWGAMMTYAAAAAAPGNWRRLVTIAVPPPGVATNAFFRYAQLKQSFYIMLFQTPLAEIVVSADDLIFIEKLWSDWSPSYDGSGDLPYVKDALRGPANLSAAIGYYRAMFAVGGGDKSPPHPTLYLHGNEDGAFLVEGIAGTDKHLSEDSRVEIIDGTGHFLHLEKPAAVNRMILDWIGAR